jgi:hypothetical protein
MSVFLQWSGNTNSHEQDGETLSGAAERNVSLSARRSCHGHDVPLSALRRPHCRRRMRLAMIESLGKSSA